MLQDVAVGALGVGATGFVLVRALLPFQRIWRGDASAAPSAFASMSVQVKARNYLAYLLWLVPAFGGLLLVCGAVLVDVLLDRPGHILLRMFTVGISLFAAAAPLMLVHVFVNATNRPRFLVPPPYRDQPGAVAARRQRRARKRAGQPPTDHLVEILEVPDDAGGQPWLIAVCSDDECDWIAETDPDLGYSSAEHRLRRRARKHTSNVAATIRRPLAGRGPDSPSAHS